MRSTLASASRSHAAYVQHQQQQQHQQSQSQSQHSDDSSSVGDEEDEEELQRLLNFAPRDLTEQQRKMRRKYQNRIAAQKSRQGKRVMLDEQTTTTYALRAYISALQQQIRELGAQPISIQSDLTMTHIARICRNSDPHAIVSKLADECDEFGDSMIATHGNSRSPTTTSRAIASVASTFASHSASASNSDAEDNHSVASTSASDSMPESSASSSSNRRSNSTAVRRAAAAAAASATPATTTRGRKASTAQLSAASSRQSSQECSPSTTFSIPQVNNQPPQLNLNSANPALAQANQVLQQHAAMNVTVDNHSTPFALGNSLGYNAMNLTGAASAPASNLSAGNAVFKQQGNSYIGVQPQFQQSGSEIQSSAYESNDLHDHSWNCQRMSINGNTLSSEQQHGHYFDSNQHEQPFDFSSESNGFNQGYGEYSYLPLATLQQQCSNNNSGSSTICFGSLPVPSKIFGGHQPATIAPLELEPQRSLTLPAVEYEVTSQLAMPNLYPSSSITGNGYPQ